MNTQDIKRRWVDPLKDWGEEEREEIVQLVHKRTDIPVPKLRQQLKQADKKWRKSSVIDAEKRMRLDAATSGRDFIVWDPANHEALLPDVVRGLCEHQKDPKVLSHGGGLVSVQSIAPQYVRMTSQSHDEDAEPYPKMTGISRHDRVTMRLRAMEAIRFVRMTKDGLRPIEVPVGLVDSILVSHNDFPVLTGVVVHPLVTPDGRLLAIQGHDRRTGLFFHFPNHIVPTLSDDLSQARAAQALKYLQGTLFAEFPFRSETDLAGAIAMLLTVAQRHFIGGQEGCPGFVVTAPAQATGKTALARLISLVLLDRPVPASSWSANDDEMGKRILSILMEGHGLVVFDNIQEGAKITGTELAKAMTGTAYSSRLLGFNKSVKVASTCTWIFTGNNICPSGDFNTRLLTISMDSKEEHPDRREFARADLSDWCSKHRADVLRELFILLMSGYRARKGKKIPLFKPTRFPEWDKMVRAPMLWAGSHDPALLFEQNKANDPMMEGRINFLQAWFELYKSTPVTLKKVLEDDFVSHTESKQRLSDAIQDILSTGVVTSTALSGFVRRIKGRVMGGLKIESIENDGSHKGSQKWRVSQV